MKKFLLFTLLTSLSSLSFGQKSYQPTWSSLDARPVPGWFEDAKFGIFVHWGVYSVPAYSPTVRDSVGIYDRYAEHYWRRLYDGGKTQHFFEEFHKQNYAPGTTYQDLARDFKAELFKPDEWATLFERSGAKYVVLTAKHHEGYTLWPSKYAWNWNVMDVGPHRDLLGGLTKAVRAKNLKMGYYYSLLEWFNPLYKKETLNDYIDQHMFPQMKELVSTYNPDVLWTDGEWDYSSEQLRSPEFLAWLYNDSSVKESVAINDRWGKETRGKHGGYYTTEYDLVYEGNADSVQFNHPWEECRGMAGSFGYNRAEILDDYSTSKELVHILINKVGRGGNLLLNIGPTADGRVPVIMQQRLNDMGAWLNVNGQSIYGTRAWSKAPKVDAKTTTFFTTKGADLYVITTVWQEKLILSGVSASSKVSLLGFNGLIRAVKKGNTLTITAPSLSPTTMPCQYAWVYKVTGGGN
ncbi:alpha-L-fucosidase (plasmid) [Spirosoma sp. SC4-14]|uniref:alpha-L-fucosidase n=1 Tax=Spirosoma sp. SC4-14 TaxID=3128900 RepID=UPI0030D3040A